MENERRICEFVIEHEFELIELKQEKRSRYYTEKGEELDVNFDEEEEDEN